MDNYSTMYLLAPKNLDKVVAWKDLNTTSIMKGLVPFFGFAESLSENNLNELLA